MRGRGLIIVAGGLVIQGCGGSELVSAGTRDVAVLDALDVHADALDADTTDSEDPAPCGDCFACERDGCDPIVHLAVSRLAACALLASGQPVCWGRPIAGALGEGLDGSAPLDPLRVDDRPALVQLGLAGSHACGRDSDGAIWCWGDNYFGIVGAPPRDLRVSLEARGPILERARDLVLGPLGTACARVDASVDCWGLRLDGVESDEVGATFVSTPETIEGLPESDALVLAIGRFFACAWDAAGDSVRCFGANSRGQLGAGDGPGTASAVAVTRTWGDAPIDLLAVGGLHACIVADDALWCWGALETNASEPRLVASELGGVHALAAGDGFTCAALGPTLSVRCWGIDSPALDDVVELVAAGTHICARTSHEAVSCWFAGGEPSASHYASAHPARCEVADVALAAGDDHPDLDCRVCTELSSEGAMQPCPLGCSAGHCQRAEALAAGDAHTCALLDDGAVSCWGERTFGAVDGVASPGVAAPTRVLDVPPLITVTAGARHTCGLDAAGDVHCWGRGASPTLRAEARVGAIDAGTAATCAIMPGGGVTCWGFALDGSDWTDFDAAQDVPPYVIGGLDGVVIEHVAVAEDAACASERGASVVAARVFCWGLGQVGELARPVGSIAREATAATLFAPSIVAGLAAGRAHLLLFAGGSDRSLIGWGDNALQQLGLGTTSLAATGVQIIGDWRYNFAAVSAGDASSCALERTGRVTCWGSQSHGQLGPAAARATSSTPVEIPDLGPLVAIAAGARHTCAVDVAGFVWCWGDNTRAQLGGGIAGSDYAPVPRWVTQ